MVASGQPRIVSPIAIDREVELERIEHALEAVLGGTPTAVLIGGEAGIGKTRLVTEALRRTETDGIRVVRGSCLAFGASIPYLPFVEMLRALDRELPATARASILGPVASELAAVLPSMAPQRAAIRSDAVRDVLELDRPRVGPGVARGRPGATTEDGLGLARLRLFDGFLRVAERLAANEAIVAVVEDLQWADDASLALLAYLRHNLRHGPVLLLLTARTDEMTDRGLAFLADIERDEHVERIDLAGFSVEHTARQVAAILGRRPQRTHVIGIHTLSGGNPFYAEELLASGDTDATTGHVVVQAADLAPRLRDALRARTERLPSEGQAVLRAAAITDRVVGSQLLARIAGMATKSLDDGLRAALDEHLLVPVPFAHGTGYRFRHELVRTFVASELLPTESARLHAAYAMALAAMPTPDGSSGELAFHWDAAGDDGRAFSAHVEAGLDAETAYAFEAAHRHFERALDLWDWVPDADDRSILDRSRLTQRAADAAARAGRLDRAIELAQVVLATASPEQADLIADMRSGLRWYLSLAGRTAEALAQAERAVAETRIEQGSTADSVPGADVQRANDLAHLAGLRMLNGDLARASREAGEALAAAIAAGARDEAALARGVQGWCLIHAGHVDDGIDEIRAVLDAARSEEVPHVPGVALAYGQLARALELAGRIEESVEAASAGVAWSADHGLERAFGRALYATRARGLYHLGLWHEAVDVTAAGLDLGTVGPGAFALIVARAIVGVAQGDDEAVTDASASRLPDLSDATVIDDSDGWLAAVQLERTLWDPKPASALGLLEAMGLRDDVPYLRSSNRSPTAGGRTTFDASLPRRLALLARAIAELCLLERVEGRASEARHAVLSGSVEREVRRIERRKALAAAWRHELAVARAELVRARDPGSRHEADMWRHAADAASTLGRPYAEAYARWRRAEALLASRGDRIAATAEVRRGLGLASRLGARPLTLELEQLARRARLVLVGEEQQAAGIEVPTTPDAPFELTERELEVLALLAAGDTNRVIGQKLFISPRTASVHVSNILGKMGVGGRVEAAGLALRLGLAGTDPDDVRAQR